MIYTFQKTKQNYKRESESHQLHKEAIVWYSNDCLFFYAYTFSIFVQLLYHNTFTSTSK